MTIQLVKPVACCRLERRARYMMSSWTQATAGMFATDTSEIFETHSFERAKWIVHPVQDSFQRMDNLLSPVLLKVLRPEGRNCNVALFGCPRIDESDFMH